MSSVFNYADLVSLESLFTDDPTLADMVFEALDSEFQVQLLIGLTRIKAELELYILSAAA